MEVIEAINEARLSRFHSKAIFVSGMGFFTDAYDLFIIGVASTLLTKQWHLSATQTGLINSMTLLGAFLGACVLGRLADLLGRRRIAVFDASVMLVFALASAVAPSFIFLVGFRFLLGFGVGGDYPVSAVLMSEYANRRDRGRLVGLVFAMQALGTVAGYIAGLLLIWAGVDHGLLWRILLGLGAVPSALVLYARLRMPESPRYLAWVKGDGRGAADGVRRFSGGKVVATGTARAAERLSLRQFLSDRRLMLTLLGTAGTGSCSTTRTTATLCPPLRSSSRCSATERLCSSHCCSTYWCSRSRRYRVTSSRAFSWTGSATAGCS